MVSGEGTHLVLAGGGHAHLPALKNAAEFARRGIRVTLVSPEPYHYYSGMGPGLLSGLYRPAQARFHVRRMIEDRGGSFVQDRVVSVDAGRRTLTLASGRQLAYDLASFNTGSRVPLEVLPGAASAAVPVKPVENLTRARAEIVERLRAGAPRFLVVGGGPAGVEVAGNLLGLALGEGARAEVTLAAGESRLLPALPERASRIARASLEARGGRVLCGSPLVSLSDGRGRTGAGDEIPCDLAIAAVGVRPTPVFAGSGLAVDAQGALLVDDHLESVSHPGVFGGGDCVTLRGRELARVGVYAVREGPVLFRNLLAAAAGGMLESFRPQRRYLLILNLGDGTGLAAWGPCAWRARWALAWKNRLDTGFMARFQVSGEAAEADPEPAKGAAPP